MPDKMTQPPGSLMIPQTATPKAGTPGQHTLTPRPDPTPDSWYIERRDALMEGDAGTLPSGDTCAEQREEYAAIAVAESSPAQTLISLNPAAATVGGADFTLQAIGTGFISGDIIVVNDVVAATTFVSGGTLETPIVGSSLTAGSVPVLVRRTGGTDTAPVNFTVT